MSQLILMRHGESIWNKRNLFTGWVDIPLSLKGIQEALDAGKDLQNIPIDVAFTSSLVRAQETLVLALADHGSKKVPVFYHTEEKLDKWGQIYSDATKKEIIPVFSSWHLNERMYGELQGLNKKETADKFGIEQVQIWRRSYDTAPPSGESLADCSKRTWPYFEKNIVPALKKGENVLVVAHGNSLRSIIMHLDQLTKEEIVHLEIPLGRPILYSYLDGAFTK